MNQSRGLLFIGLLVFTFLGVQAWVNDDYIRKNPPQPPKQSADAVIDTASNIKLYNNVLSLTVNSKTGYFVGANLLKYPRTVEDKTSLNLLNTDTSKISEDGFLQLSTGLHGAQGTYTSSYSEDYKIVEQKDNSVLLQMDKNGVVYQKLVSLDKNNADSYVVNINYKVFNNTDHDISLAPYATFKVIPTPAPNMFSRSNVYGTNASYQGIITSTDDDNYDKTSFDSLKDKPLKTKDGWLAYSNHFFVVAYAPSTSMEVNGKQEVAPAFTISANPAQQTNQFNFVNVSNDVITIAKGDTQTFSEKVWIGPKLQDQLAEVAPDLNLVVDYGWAWFLSLPLYKLLTWLHSFIPNWGLAIIALTITVRIILFPLSRIQFKNQALMRILQPELQAANERAGSDRLRKMQETQRVFAKYGASQFAGCLPALITAPIFLALFYLINEAVELRLQPFFGWIHDLSQTDPYFILPIINGAVMIYMFRLTPQPATMDPLQRKIMNFMPWLFTIFFLFLPSGLMLYYIVSNLITICMIKYWTKKITTAYNNKTLPTYDTTGRQKTQKRAK